jgi:hypothetical protein
MPAPPPREDARQFSMPLQKLPCQPSSQPSSQPSGDEFKVLEDWHTAGGCLDPTPDQIMSFVILFRLPEDDVRQWFRNKRSLNPNKASRNGGSKSVMSTRQTGSFTYLPQDIDSPLLSPEKSEQSEPRPRKNSTSPPLEMVSLNSKDMPEDIEIPSPLFGPGSNRTHTSSNASFIERSYPSTRSLTSATSTLPFSYTNSEKSPVGIDTYRYAQYFDNYPLPFLSYVHAEPSNRHEPKAKEGFEVMAFEPDRRNGKEIDVDSKEILRKPVPSDSGYHSGLGTDTESVCSMGSVETSLGLPQDFLQEFIAFFGDMLIDKAGVRAWAGYALAQYTPEDIEQRLNGLLKDYTVELLSATETSQGAAVQHTTPNQGGGTDNRIASGAIKLIRRYRPKIARYFRDNAVSAPLTPMSMTARLQELSKQLSLTEKLDLFGRAAPSRRDPSEAIKDVQPEDDIEEHLDNLAPIRDFLVSSEAFQNLATAMRRSLYCDDRTGMDEIRCQVLEGLSEAADLTCCPNCSDDDEKRCSNHQSFYSVRFNVIWGLRGFLQSQFGNRRAPQIGTLVALTGSALYAQATTCFDYLQTTWPRSGAFFLSTLQTAVDSGGNLDNQKNGNSTGKASFPLLTPYTTKIAWILISTLRCSYVLPKDHPTNILRHLLFSFTAIEIFS